jgi:hypothetical protein
VIFIELLFVFRSLWQDKSGYYYVFGFLSCVSLVLIVTVIEVTIVTTYVQLCAEVSSSPPSRIISSLECEVVLTLRYRTTTGGGNPSSSVVPAPSGSSCIALGTISPSSTSKATYRVCYFSVIVRWRVECMGWRRGRWGF